MLREASARVGSRAGNRVGMPKLDKLLDELDGLEIEFPIEPPTPDELAT